MKHSKNCQVCGGLFKTNHTGALYCSNKCKQKSFRDKRNGELILLRKGGGVLRKSNEVLRKRNEELRKQWAKWKEGDPFPDYIRREHVCCECKKDFIDDVSGGSWEIVDDEKAVCFSCAPAIKGCEMTYS